MHALMIAGVVGAFALPASAATFDFRDGNLTPNGVYPSPTASISVDGIGVFASAGTYASDAITEVDSPGASVSKSDNGLGVVRLFQPPEIDGGVFVNDLLTLTFDQPVFFESLVFTETDGDDDFDLFIDGAIFASEVGIGGANPFTYLFATGVSGTSISIGADAGTFNNLDEDDFRLGAVTVAPVPVPAALPLMAAGLGALLVVSRRRNG